MGNQKQDGSNVINAEYTTGRCRTQCEQCFVNFGQQGQATCKAIVKPDWADVLKWIEAQSKEFGRYTAPPKFKRVGKLPAGREWLLRKLTKKGKGMTNIPTKGAWYPRVLERQYAQRKKRQVVKSIEHLGEFPFFLRVSSMSDSSWAPFEWLDGVYNAWGDHCFYNSAIRSLKRATDLYGIGLMDRYHKLVVTVNPGHQKLRDFREQTSRSLDPGERSRETNQWARENHERLSAAGSMGEPIEKDRDFFHPQSLSDIGLGSYEDVIKFYRLRALPTVQPRFETDAPVVITQMRFKGLDHGLEFCRRYGLKCEVRTPLTKKGNVPPSIGKAVAPFARLGHEIKIVVDKALPAKQLYIWTPKRHKFNASPHAGEASVFMWEDSFFRNIHPEAFDHEDYVCDRRHESCKACGLCASLDGTQAQDTNWLNVNQDGEVMPPLIGPEGSHYLGDVSPEATDFFNEILSESVALSGFEELAGLEELGTFYRNPIEPLEPDVVADMLSAVAAYVDKELTLDTDWCEGWNTHELSATTTAYAIWSLMVDAKLRGMSKQSAFDHISKLVADVAGPYDVLDGVGDVWGMWDDDSDWTDQFGTTG